MLPSIRCPADLIVVIQTVLGICTSIAWECFRDALFSLLISRKRIHLSSKLPLASPVFLLLRDFHCDVFDLPFRKRVYLDI